MKYKSNLQIEYFAGDCMKIVGEVTEQMIFEDMLQIAEVMALAEKIVKRLRYPQKTKRRPVAPATFMQGYTSANDHTRSKIIKEDNLGARVSLLRDVFAQMLVYDGILKESILALTQSYLDEHILETDIS
nr:hypothetical protein BdHM001_34850 [Bdellovibrio sp. HM001]